MARLWIGILITLASGAHAQQLAVVAPASSPSMAGRVLFVTGDVQSLDYAGIARPLSKGDVVREGELIRTGADSHVQLRMSDDALLALRPDSRVRLHTYRFVEQGEAGGGRASIEVLVGGLRSITGAIGRNDKQNYMLRGGKALIGVRGTDHETFVVDAGTYNRVTLGGTYLESAGSRINLDPTEVGFAGVGDERPARLARTPQFMYAAFEQSAPAFNAEGRVDELGDERRRGGLKLGHDKEQGRPDHAAGPVLPPRALGENAHKGFSKGGRCGGPCSDPKIK
jgi:hypothetical protein